MKLQEYFLTPRGYKRLAIWAAVVLLTIPAMRPITFLLHNLEGRMSVIRHLALCLVAAFVILLLVALIVQRIRRKPMKRFAWFCAGTAVVIYSIYAFCFTMIIHHKPSTLGAVRMEGKYELYNPIGWRITKWDKPYNYIAEYYNTHTRQRCYMGLYTNPFYWVDVTGLIEIDIFDKDWKPIDHCAAMVAKPDESALELGEFLKDAVGIETKKIYGEYSCNSWSDFRDLLADGYYPYGGYEFVTYDGVEIHPFERDYNDGIFYGWSNEDFYDPDQRLIGKSFKHLPVQVLTRPGYMNWSVNPSICLTTIKGTSKNNL